MTHEVMIQDVNPPNALIFLHGYMYVGGSRHLAAPRWFAPYFTEDCAEAGIRFYSVVFDVVTVGVKDLQRHPKKSLSLHQNILSHTNWPRWRRGLAAIAERARKEEGTLHFTSDYDPHRLYFLGAPMELNRTIKKAGQSQLPYGFGCSFADLSEMRDLSDRGRP